jgi:hypothetical protein
VDGDKNQAKEFKLKMVASRMAPISKIEGEQLPVFGMNFILYKLYF